MNRIDQIFQDLRSSEGGGEGGGRKALMPFITAGDPDVATSIALLPALEAAGASICEIGIPFSDPIADGPVIQESMTHALSRGATVQQTFDAVAAIRGKVKLGLVAMVSYSIVHRMGLERFINEAKAAGFDGFIFPDLSLEESGPARAAVSKAGLILSMLIAPTTPIERAKQIAAASTGFVYVISRAGITGEQAELPPDLMDRLARIREATRLPIAVGFGISSAQHVSQVVRIADAAIVGSAFVRRIAEHRDSQPRQLVESVGAFARELASGLSQEAGAV